jgi:hypothetical protein
MAEALAEQATHRGYEPTPQERFVSLVTGTLQGANDLLVSYQALARVVVDDKLVLMRDRHKVQSADVTFAPLGGLVTVPWEKAGELTGLTDSQFSWRSRRRGDRAAMDFCVPQSYAMPVLTWLRRLSYKDKNPKGQMEDAIRAEDGLIPIGNPDALPLTRYGYSAVMRRWQKHGRSNVQLALTDVWSLSVGEEAADKIRVEAAGMHPQVLLTPESDLIDLIKQSVVRKYMHPLVDSTPQFQYPSSISK